MPNFNSFMYYESNALNQFVGLMRCRTFLHASMSVYMCEGKKIILEIYVFENKFAVIFSLLRHLEVNKVVNLKESGRDVCMQALCPQIGDMFQAFLVLEFKCEKHNFHMHADFKKLCSTSRFCIDTFN